MENDLKTDVEKALAKRAMGYDVQEVIEEFAAEEEGGERLVRKKVTTKNVPPDVAAAKLLLEISEGTDLSALSDGQLEEEKNRLLKILEGLNENSKG